MAIVKNDTVTPAGFSTIDPYTGAPTNASATSAYCYENGGTTQITGGITVNDLTATETGNYTVTVDTSNAAYSAGNSYVLFAEATVNSVASAPIELFAFGLASSATVSADIVSISGDSGAADNLELDYDGTGYAKTNSTIGTVTTATNAEADIAALNDFDPSGDTVALVTEVTNLSDLIIRAGTAQAGGATTITLDAGASATNDLYNGAGIIITGGTGAGQVRPISDYVGSTKVATVSTAWATNPDATSTFIVTGTGSGATSGGGDATAAKQDEILVDLVDIKGTGFVKDTNSLVNIAGGITDTYEEDVTLE